MNKPLITLAVASLITGMSGTAFADHGHGRGHGHGHQHQTHGHNHPGRGHHPGPGPAYAQVISVQPIVHVVSVPTPHQTCRTEEVIHRSGGHESPLPTVLGGVVGGVIGNRVGGSNRDVATVAGAVLGAAIGNDIGRQHAGGKTVVTTQERCRTINSHHQEQRVEGYWVTYRYNGEHFTTRTDHHPGNTLRLQVALR